ncbi:ATP phosphoribosyltransferase [Campylobacter sp. 19-13652]|uniref:ATP phosphoribosyltransferase n=1 Tax=Campylobacter sp. 19-13652 TaxID=2840180 RepID=UPI001C7866FB|nr:ATP phosphoribosyltransferase [Campylobacter sp. 19-13652]BCX79778.1 ATP phosphoribosyltransferase [Campylobacter sp. 19-13652]
MITVALPKGRIANQTLEIFESVFKSEFKFEDRKLILNQGDFRFLMVRNQDIPAYVVEGAADVGVVGLDVLAEHRPDVVRLLDLKIGKCRICVGTVAGKEPDFTQPEIKVATKMPQIAREYFANHAIAAKIIKLYGSIELAPLIGLSDVIVDVVETGATMKQNGLTVTHTIMQSSAHLIANKSSYIVKKEAILDLYEKIASHVNG